MTLQRAKKVCIMALAGIALAIASPAWANHDYDDDDEDSSQERFHFDNNEDGAWAGTEEEEEEEYEEEDEEDADDDGSREADDDDIRHPHAPAGIRVDACRHASPACGVPPLSLSLLSQGGSNAHGTADRAASLAIKMVGKRYRYGGVSPSTGFDCSGLVQFSFRQAGIPIPRSTDEQRRASRPVTGSKLQRGDLLFFDQEGKENSHVGIYVGKGEFVHAPSSRKHVRADRLDAPYWRAHLSEVRRIKRFAPAVRVPKDSSRPAARAVRTRQK
jgi:cell wall-associated NlpC family hydrolase